MSQYWNQPYKPDGALSADGNHKCRLGEPDIRFTESAKCYLQIPFVVIEGYCQGQTEKIQFWHETEFGCNQLKAFIVKVNPSFLSLPTVDDAVEVLLKIIPGLIVEINQKSNGDKVYKTIAKILDRPVAPLPQNPTAPEMDTSDDLPF